jgi:hypothetical protein
MLTRHKHTKKFQSEPVRWKPKSYRPSLFSMDEDSRELLESIRKNMDYQRMLCEEICLLTKRLAETQKMYHALRRPIHNPAIDPQPSRLIQ